MVMRVSGALDNHFADFVSLLVALFQIVDRWVMLVLLQVVDSQLGELLQVVDNLVMVGLLQVVDSQLVGLLQDSQ